MGRDGTRCVKEPRTAVSGSSPAWGGIGNDGTGLDWLLGVGSWSHFFSRNVTNQIGDQPPALRRGARLDRDLKIGTGLI